MLVDYIIVGQGICGTFLSWHLQQAGKKVMVIDADKPNSASKVASGVINPVTGRRIVRTWLIETIMPFAVETYQQIGISLGQNLIRQCNILDFHPTPQMQLAFTDRLPQEPDYLRLPINPTEWQNYFNYPFGVGEINSCWLIDLQTMLQQYRQQLQANGNLLSSDFDYNVLQHSETGVQYQDITAEKIIFCDGVGGTTNPFFQLLPFATNKGQALIVRIPNLPNNYMYKHGFSIVPWQNDLFWVGSTYEWKYNDDLPSADFRAKTEVQLQQFLKLPNTVVDHIAAERPANIERRPFVGFHPIYHNIGILNGMGTKGCSLAPYFAHQLTQLLVANKPIHPLADIVRFSRILSR